MTKFSTDRTAAPSGRRAGLRNMRGRKAALALSVAGLAAAGAVATAAPASAAGSYIYTQSGRPAALATCWAACGATGRAIYPANGTGASMFCYTDQGSYDGNYSSNRWFVVSISGQPGQWFIHSSYVYYQTSVAHC